MKPEFFTSGAHYRANWKCRNCGCKWDVEIRSRIKFKSGCSRCGFNIFDGKIHENAINRTGAKRRKGIEIIDFI